MKKCNLFYPQKVNNWLLDSLDKDAKQLYLTKARAIFQRYMYLNLIFHCLNSTFWRMNPYFWQYLYDFLLFLWSSIIAATAVTFKKTITNTTCTAALNVTSFKNGLCYRYHFVLVLTRSQKFVLRPRNTELHCYILRLLMFRQWERYAIWADWPNFLFISTWARP